MKSLLSFGYMLNARPNCRLLLRQLMACALPLARDNAGKSIAARMAMIAMTTNSSISVKAITEAGERRIQTETVFFTVTVILGLGHGTLLQEGAGMPRCDGAHISSLAQKQNITFSF